MYGSRAKYEGRIPGFTMGTGRILTGNFARIVQRLLRTAFHSLC
jgi:hypothetical protein